MFVTAMMANNTITAKSGIVVSCLTREQIPVALCWRFWESEWPRQGLHDSLLMPERSRNWYACGTPVWGFVQRIVSDPRSNPSGVMSKIITPGSESRPAVFRYQSEPLSIVGAPNHQRCRFEAGLRPATPAPNEW